MKCVNDKMSYRLELKKGIGEGWKIGRMEEWRNGRVVIVGV